MSIPVGDEDSGTREPSNPNEGVRAGWRTRARDAVATAEVRARRWARAPADPLGAPFAAARRRLIAIDVSVVAAVLAVVGIAVYLYDAHAEQQQTITELQYYATTGAGIAAEHGGGPPGGTTGRLRGSCPIRRPRRTSSRWCFIPAARCDSIPTRSCSSACRSSVRPSRFCKVSNP